jgi:hypothetical protein
MPEILQPHHFYKMAIGDMEGYTVLHDQNVQTQQNRIRGLPVNTDVEFIFRGMDPFCTDCPRGTVRSQGIQNQHGRCGIPEIKYNHKVLKVMEDIFRKSRHEFVIGDLFNNPLWERVYREMEPHGFIGYITNMIDDLRITIGINNFSKSVRG